MKIGIFSYNGVVYNEDDLIEVINNYNKLEDKYIHNVPCCNEEDCELYKNHQQLKDRINKAIFYMENYISVEEYNEPVKCEFGIVIKLLKGDKE